MNNTTNSQGIPPRNNKLVISIQFDWRGEIDVSNGDDTDKALFIRVFNNKLVNFLQTRMHFQPRNLVITVKGEHS